MKEITIVIPTYNRAHLISRTLDSVLRQTYRPLHVIVVDNNSSDNTLNVLHAFKADNEAPDLKITIAEEHTPGAAAARRRGSLLADTEWIMFFDSDDAMLPDLVEKYVEKIESNDCDLVATRASYVGCDGSTIETPYYEHNLLINHLLHSPLSTQRYIIKRSRLDAVGGWRDDIMAWNDWELGIRILLANPKIAFLSDKIRVNIIATKESITGTDFHSKCGVWEHTLDAVRLDIEQSNHPDKEKLLRYVDHRCVVLAGHYRHEGHPELGKQLYEDALARSRHDWRLRLLFPVIYRYVACGMRGAAQIIKRILR